MENRFQFKLMMLDFPDIQQTLNFDEEKCPPAPLKNRDCERVNKELKNIGEMLRQYWLEEMKDRMVAKHMDGTLASPQATFTKLVTQGRNWDNASDIVLQVIDKFHDKPHGRVIAQTVISGYGLPYGRFEIVDNNGKTVEEEVRPLLNIYETDERGVKTTKGVWHNFSAPDFSDIRHKPEKMEDFSLSLYSNLRNGKKTVYNGNEKGTDVVYEGDDKKKYQESIGFKGIRFLLKQALRPQK